MKWKAWLWLLVVLLCAGHVLTIGVRGNYDFDSNIMALLPEAEHAPAEKIAIERLLDSADNSIIFLIGDNDKQRSAQAAQQFVQTLSDSKLCSDIQASVSNALIEQWQDFYRQRRYQLLSADDRQRLAAGGRAHRELVDQSLGRLYSPLASVVAPQLIEDPLQLHFNWQILAMPSSPLYMEDSWLTIDVVDVIDAVDVVDVAVTHYRFISVTLAGNTYDVPFQNQVLACIADAEAALPAGTVLLRSGFMLHAAYGAAQAQWEISTIGIGSLLGIIILLMVCFRSPMVLLMSLLSLMVACLCALSVCMLVFDRVHLITLAFGAGLVGVAIDYSLHYFCACQEIDGKTDEERDGTTGAHDGQAKTQTEVGTSVPRKAISMVAPSLRLALISSVLAYLAQGMAPFPGLRQMAVFSACGLIAACISVVYWIPVIGVGRGLPQHRRLMAVLKMGLRRWPNIENRMVCISMAAFIAVIGVMLTTVDGDDDIRKLQTSPPSMIAESRQVQELLAAPSIGQFFIIKAANAELLLQTEEAFAPLLDAAIDAGAISSWLGVSGYVPSQARQGQDYALQEQYVYAEHGLLSQFVNRGSFPDLEDEIRESFKTLPFAALTVEQWIADDVSRLGSHLWIGDIDGMYYSVISLHDVAGTQACEDLAQLAAGSKSVLFVDRVGGISRVLQVYRQHMVYWITLAYAAVFAVLTLRYGRHAWRVLAAPALASVAVIGILSFFGVSITVFHSLALLLVLGIGLDASIFLHDSRSSSYAWLAVCLSSLSTLLAFGLLAWSATPVLHFFGQTVLLGIILVWLLAPCFVRRTVVDG